MAAGRDLSDARSPGHRPIDASSSGAASSALRALFEAGILGPLDLRFGELLARLEPTAAVAAVVAAAVAFAARERGHVCLDLDDPSQRAMFSPSSEARALLDAQLDSAKSALAEVGFVRAPDSAAETPLVFDSRRLYLDRLHLAESTLVTAIAGRLAKPEPIDAATGAGLAASIRRLFGVSADAPFTDQMRAVLIAARSRFCLVTGGPGTGKTTTVVRILALLMEQQPGLRIRLLAPTGKAAARLSESIRAQTAALESEFRDAIPTDASTLHRALGMRPDRPSRPRHDARSPLPCDVVVVDEASMVDVELMARLFDALEPDTRVVLLGDRDQLASVEAGSVLGDLAGPAYEPVRASPAMVAAVASVCPWPSDRVGDGGAPLIADCVAVLEASRRFDPSRGIGRLATAVRDGDLEALRSALRSDEVAHVDPSDRAGLAGLERQVVARFARVVESRTPERALASLDHLRVLCAVRKGEDGVEEWNARILAALVRQRLVPRGRVHFHGRPVLVTTNDYDVQLYNGDVGIELEVEGALRVYFADPRPEVRFRSVSPARLPPHETVYAMTIHKSQGSEVDEVVMVLPREESRVLGRELVYTGLTRARSRVTVLSTQGTLERALRTTVVRGSGLRERLWGRAQAPGPQAAGNPSTEQSAR